MHRGERGMTLIEVLAALAILGGAGSALVATLAAAMQEERHSQMEERRVDAASRVLAATSLLSKADLDRRLGERTVGEFVVRVGRPEAALYRVGVAEQASPGLELLTTVLFRAEEPKP